ncbi:MAG: site-specific integrase [Bacteroidia bacterium]
MQIAYIRVMKNEVFISIYLDTRRSKSNGKYPVKLRVFTTNPRVQKLYPTKYEYTDKEFDSIWNTLKPRKEFKHHRKQLLDIEDNATEISKEMEYFDFTLFEKKYFRNNGEGSDVFYHYGKTIESLIKYKQLGTASNYRLSEKSIKKYLKDKTGKEIDKLHFKEITINWLKDYESYMVDANNRSYTTVSMYLRALRTLFNNAIKDKDIESTIYPFGDGKYVIPASQNIKKALSKADLKSLFHSKPLTPEQEKAKDFWFFSYACNGMNIKDIALLKWGNIKGETIEFYRSKTKNTSKSKLKPVQIILNDFTKQTIEKYGSSNKERDQLIFPFIMNGKSDLENFNKIKNFTKFINQNLKKLAISNGITGDISTYWARHSFATNAVRLGASMEFVSEALSHNNLKTTQSYFAGFEEDSKIEIMEKLMAF